MGWTGEVQIKKIYLEQGSRELGIKQNANPLDFFVVAFTKQTLNTINISHHYFEIRYRIPYLWSMGKKQQLRCIHWINIFVENRYYSQLGNIYNSHVVGTLLEMSKRCHSLIASRDAPQGKSRQHNQKDGSGPHYSLKPSIVWGQVHLITIIKFTVCEQNRWIDCVEVISVLERIEVTPPSLVSPYSTSYGNNFQHNQEEGSNPHFNLENSNVWGHYFTDFSILHF